MDPQKRGFKFVSYGSHKTTKVYNALIHYRDIFLMKPLMAGDRNFTKLSRSQMGASGSQKCRITRRSTY